MTIPSYEETIAFSMKDVARQLRKQVGFLDAIGMDDDVKALRAIARRLTASAKKISEGKMKAPKWKGM